MLELLQDKEEFLKELNEMGLPGVAFKAEPSVKCGITGTCLLYTSCFKAGRYQFAENGLYRI